MEELINKLIEKGWKPRWIYTSLIVWYWLVRCEEYVWSPNNERKSYRELVSKESWLRQFCVENNLVKLIENPNENKCPRDRMDEEEHRIWEYDVYYSFSTKKDIHKRYEQNSSTYRIIESSLKDENELEDFLLDNIKI